MLTDADADIVRRDATLPNLRRALDPERLTEWVASVWPGGGVQSVTANYLRYKPATSCLARFDVRTEAAVYSGYALFFRDSESAKLRGLPTGSVADRDSLLVPYPGDRRIRGLGRLTDSEEFAALTNRLGMAKAGEPHFQLLRHKPERRAVGAVVQDGRPVAALRFYSRRDFGVAKRAFRAARWAAPEVEYLGSSDRLSAMATRWIDGVVAGDEAASLAIEAVANRLARLHDQHRVKLHQPDRQAWSDRLDIAVRTLQVIAPPLASRIAPHLQALRDGLARAVSRVVVTHGDAHLDQFVIDPQTGAARLIDFDRALLAVAEWDLANLYADLNRRRTDFGLEQLVLAYGRPVDATLLKAMTALRLLELAVDPFRNRLCDWCEESERLVNDACLTHCDGAPASSRTLTGLTTETRYEALSDPGLPRLRQALDPEVAEARFLELRNDRGQPCGVVLSQARVLRHKAGRRCLIEYTGREAASGQPVTLLGKLEAKSRSERRLSAQRLLWESGFDDQAADGIRVAPPWAAVPEWRLWLQQKVPGTTATRLLLQPGGEAVARRLGEAIAKLHQADLPCEEHYSVDQEAALLHEKLSRSAIALPELAARLLALRDRSVEVALSLESSEFTSVHRDFYSDQAIIDGPTITLVDFDLLCRSDPAIDVGNFLGCLAEHGARQGWRCDRIERLSEAFREGYGTDRIADRWRGYAALTVARHVAIAADRDDRRRHTELVLSRADELINEVR